MITKVCSKCKVEKSLDDYYGDKRQRLGVQPCCKECFKKRAYAYRRSPRGRSVWKKYVSRPEFRKIANSRLCAFRKTGKFKEYWKKYVRTDGFKKYMREFEKKNRQRPDVRFKDKVRCEKYRAQKISSSDGTVTVDSVQELLKQQENKCKLCGISLNERKPHMDHIYPISKGGVHTISNIQWLCYICNISKSNKI